MTLFGVMKKYNHELASIIFHENPEDSIKALSDDFKPSFAKQMFWHCDYDANQSPLWKVFWIRVNCSSFFISYNEAKIKAFINAHDCETLTYTPLGRSLYEEDKNLITSERKPYQNRPDRKSTRLNSSHIQKSRMPSSA